MEGAHFYRDVSFFFVHFITQEFRVLYVFFFFGGFVLRLLEEYL